MRVCNVMQDTLGSQLGRLSMYVCNVCLFVFICSVFSAASGCPRIVDSVSTSIDSTPFHNRI